MPSPKTETVRGITVYTRPFCGYCTRALSVLKSRNLNVNEVDVGAEPERRAEMIERASTGKGGTTFPQIFIGQTHVGGCTDLLMLEAGGELDDLLTDEGVNP